MPNQITLSVHQLVDFLLRSGDIDNRVFNRSSMNEGSKIHASYQKKQSSNYLSEYPLNHTFVVDDISIRLEGRADGIIKRGEKDYCIDEIKTTTIDLNIFKDENIEWHLGQAKCYALMFALEEKLDFVGVKLTYIRQGKEKENLVVNYTFQTVELEQYIYSLLDEYLTFYNIILKKQAERNETITSLKFPFKDFRSGQKSLSKYAYAIAKNGGKLFAEAPTGIGKTMSTVFPFIKALKDDDESKIFYLTAKTPGKEAAYNAINILKEEGLKLNDIVITAKDKICFCKDKACNPDECPFAKSYYNKIQSIIRYAILNYDTFDLSTIESLAKEYQVCPFELELDLSLFCDVIICDYNYMFDPLSYMKRYFDENTSHFFALVDEVHNLIDRSREMYSASLDYSKFLLAKKSMRHVKRVKIKSKLTKINNLFSLIKDKHKEGKWVVDSFSEEEFKTLDSFVKAYQDISKEDYELISHELTEFYLDVNRFLKISDFISERYVCFYCVTENNVVMHINCLDASRFLRNSLNRIKASVLFSATLSPIDYYMDMLGGDKAVDPNVILPSPFPKDNFKLMIAPKISIKYKDREKSYDTVVEYIESFVKNKVGNYFIYSPSYEYLNIISEYPEFKKYKCYVQSRDMSDVEKEQFLLNFQPDPQETCLGFLVLGGAFGEGVDLISDRLIGAVIIGIGMPKINFESDQIVEYYKNLNMPGHDYAYLNPGMNKVMQAVGRVIRSETDKGAALLIDERYMSKQYRDLFKVEWNNYDVVLNPEEVEEYMINFFKE